MYERVLFITRKNRGQIDKYVINMLCDETCETNLC